MLKKILPLATQLVDSVSPILNNKNKTAKPSRDLSHQTSSNHKSDEQLTQSREKKLLNKMYRTVSTRSLAVAVKPKLLGDLPVFDTDDSTVTFYVLQEYSRSNSILIDMQTKQYGLPRAIKTVSDKSNIIYENIGVIFLNRSKGKLNTSHSARLERLISVIRRNPEIKVRLIPVTIIWGRTPEKEDSLFKLFMADAWEEPTISKQLFNIGVMGRDTFIQFHTPMDLAQLINKNDRVSLVSNHKDHLTAYKSYGGHQSTDKSTTDKQQTTALITDNTATLQIIHDVQHYLHSYLDQQRANILGPDLSDKRNVCDKILYSPTVKKAILKEKKLSNKSEKEIRQEAREYLNEIVTDYSYPMIRFFEQFLTWLWTQLYDGVEVKNFERIRNIAGDCQIIYVPSHRSHIDYLLLSYVIYKKGLRVPSIAAGNNLNLPIIGSMLRNGGAFFMRRTFKGNPLYSTVFKEYLHSLILRNNPIEYFVEGGRSRTGRLLPPKLGMLSMTVQSHLRQAGRPIAFIPTYIGYERLMEGGSYVDELKGRPKEAESLLGILKTGRKLERIFGTVHLSFGKPLYLDDFMTKFSVEKNSLPVDETEVTMTADMQHMVENIGIKILQNINRAAVINPISLLSLVLLSTSKLALDEHSCRQQIILYQNLVKNLPYDDDTTVTNMSASAIIDYGIKLKIIERTPHILGDMIKVDSKQAALLSYFRNNILHIYILSSFISALVVRNGKISTNHIIAIIKQMYPFLQAELFLKYSVNSIEQVIEENLNNLIEHGLLVARDDGLVSMPEINTQERQQLEVLANPIKQSLERYIMTLALLAAQGSSNLNEEQVIKLCMLLGQRISILYADDIPDAFEKALFTSFLKTLTRLNYISKDESNNNLVFDQRINDIAMNARYILNPDVMQILHKVAELDDSQINKVTEEIKATKQRKFRRKK